MHCQELDVPELSPEGRFPLCVHGKYPTRDLLTVYKAGPTRLGGILAGLTDDELKAKTTASRESQVVHPGNRDARRRCRDHGRGRG